MSKAAIICELAKASVPFHPRWLWDEWRADYSRIRDLIAQTYPDQFFDMEARMHEPGGFYRGNDARERVWHTASGKAEFTDPTALNAGPEGDALRLITLRSNDQFTTRIYGHSDRLRWLEGERTVVLVSQVEIARQGLSEGQRVTLVTAMEDDRRRAVTGL
jgi:anaerobic selenocysteine-containing dehydrogenase